MELAWPATTADQPFSPSLPFRMAERWREPSSPPAKIQDAGAAVLIPRHSPGNPLLTAACSCFWWLGLALVLLGGGIPAGAAGLPLGHKVRVTNDPLLVSTLQSQGARFVADYGAFQILDLPQLRPELTAHPQVEVCDHYNVVQLNAAALDTSSAGLATARAAVGEFAGRRMHLLQFAGPVQPAWYADLLATGARVIAYLPENAYLLYADSADLARLQTLAAAAPHVQWEGPYLDRYRLHPNTLSASSRLASADPAEFTVQMIADPPANTATLQLLDRLKLSPFRQRESFREFVHVIVTLSPADLPQVAAQPDVISIQAYFPPRPWDERQDQIIAGNLSGTVPASPGYLAWLAARGFTPAQFAASGFAVDVSDGGIDDGNASPNHFGLHVGGDPANPGRVVYHLLQGTPNAGSTLKGCDGHGTINAHIIGGYDDRSGFPFADGVGYHYGLGVCPFVLLGSSVIFDPSAFTNPSFPKLQSTAYQNGARISNNSWGAKSAGFGGVYDVQAQTFDALVRDAQPMGATYSAAGNQEMVIVFAAGNAGSASGSISLPGTAKNVLTVGASAGVQAFGGPDGDGVPDAQAASANDVAPFSGRGPCQDGRLKPDLLAPGTHISGGVVQAANPDPTGTADACFTASGVSGGLNGAPFWPAGQQFYTASSGTSHATPAVAGGCALLRQYWLNRGSNAPSPALTKAWLLNSARYLTGSGGGDTLPSNTQGFGALNLGTAFDGVSRLVWDQTPANLFTASGQTRTFHGAVAAPGQPFRVTLAWTDAPGSTTGNAYNNNLDLLVTVAGHTYKGNVFNGAYSVPGGFADFRNNVESVFLPAGLTGTFTVQVVATSINSDGVPNNTTPLDQDFALVIYNAVGVPDVAAAGLTLLAENCTPTNGAVDPGETVSLLFRLQNAGVVPTTNLVATLLPGTNVLSPSAPQTYGLLAPGGVAIGRPFTLTAAGPCGGTLTATLHLQDGANDLGNVTFGFPLGQFTYLTLLAQDFDAATPPVLPAGWSSVASGAAIPFVTTAARADTPPNSATVGTPAAPGVADLVSPAIFLAASNTVLSFRQSYNFEAAPPTGYDGGVLEIRIGSGNFTDIVAAGGSFLMGGYNLAIASDSSQILNGRSAWSGNSGSFLTTQVRLPAAAYGQTIQFRWRAATDGNNAALSGVGGWFLDSLTLTNAGHYECCTGFPDLAVFTTAAPNPVMLGRSLTYSLALTNRGPAPAADITLTDTLPPGVSLLSLDPGLIWQSGQAIGHLPALAANSGTNFAFTISPSLAGELTNEVAITTTSVNAADAHTNDVNLVFVAPPPSLTAVFGDGSLLTLQVPSLVGLVYGLEATDSLQAPDWQLLPPEQSGTGGVLQFITAVPPPGQRFYRVRCH